MKLSKPGFLRKKIIFYYTLAVVLPGLLLGFLAYRGIHNDQALREKESRRRLEMFSQVFFAAIDSSFVHFRNDQLVDSKASYIKKNEPSLLALIVKDTVGSTKLLSHKLLYLPSELIALKRDQLTQPISFDEGLKLEYIKSDFQEALRFYQKLFIKTTIPQEKTMALIASARLYNKMNQPDQAKIIYTKIKKDHPDCFLNGQIPLSLVAGLEILKINKKKGETGEMKINAREYLKLLLHPACDYDKNQFDLFYKSFKDIVPLNDAMIDSLLTEVDLQKVKTEHIIHILTGQEMIEPTGGYLYKNNKEKIYSCPVNSSDLVALISTNIKFDRDQVIMIIDFPVYLKSIAEKMFHKLDPNSTINFKINDNSEKSIFAKLNKGENLFLSIAFPDNLPQWKLFISENRPGFIATLFKAGSGTYLLIFILIILLMGLGFVFTIYTLNEELRLNKLKSEFVANVSHELKSPLTSIRMMTELLHHKRVKSEETKSAYYAIMVEESERLSHLIDNILDFSKMDNERKKYEFIDLDINELLLKFLDSISERLNETDFKIKYAHSEIVSAIKADKNALLQVFYNLIDNALKFSGSSRLIDIQLLSTEDELLLSFKDYGIGIAQKDQKKIFDRFYRCDEPQRMGIKGSGIGLTLVKKIIEAHRGRITLESIPGKGSTFFIHLPVM